MTETTDRCSKRQQLQCAACLENHQENDPSLPVTVEDSPVEEVNDKADDVSDNNFSEALSSSEEDNDEEDSSNYESNAKHTKKREPWKTSIVNLRIILRSASQ